jgi:hypothetical protein
MTTPHDDLPLNLEHAETVAGRIKFHLARTGDEAVSDLAVDVWEALAMRPMHDPPRDEALRLRDAVAAMARRLVEEIARAGLGSDRLGQSVRNLFECLELGQEGATLGLRAGENRNSMQRPL